MPQFYILQSMWSMQRLHTDGKERSTSESLKMIHNAGFDGITDHFYDEAQVKTWIREAQDYGFQIEGQCFPQNVDDLKPVLELGHKYGIHHITIQPDLRPYYVEDCIAILEGWHRLSESCPVPVYIETHRGRMTNDLIVTHHLLDRFPDLKLLGDLSHYVVAREFALPITEEDNARIERILDNSWAFHGRVASNEQIQIELSFPHHKPWVDVFLKWWEYGFRSWLRRAKDSDSLSFTCELGPKPYAIAGADGNDLSDRWQESKMLQGMVRSLWSQVVTTENARAA